MHPVWSLHQGTRSVGATGGVYNAYISQSIISFLKEKKDTGKMMNSHLNICVKAFFQRLADYILSNN
jgi:hypothetical protein